MQRKDLALRVLSTAAIMSIVTSIAAPAFADVYYIGNGSIDVKTMTGADGEYVQVTQNGKTYTDTSDEIVIKDGTSEKDATLKEAARAEGTQAKPAVAPAAGAATQELEAAGPAAGESQPDPDAGFTLNETEEDSEEGKDPTDNPTENPTEDPTEPSTDNPTENPKKDVVYEYAPADPDSEQQATKLAPTTSADPTAKTNEVTLDDAPAAAPTTPTAPAADPPAEGSAENPSKNVIRVVNDWVGRVLNIRLSNVNIKQDDSSTYADGKKEESIGTVSGMTVKGSGNTKLELDGKNVLDSTDAVGAAGLYKDNGDGWLTITDKTDDQGKEITSAKKDGSGSLTAKTEKLYGGAAIGGVGRKDTKNIIIEGYATVNALGSECGAGIGGGGFSGWGQSGNAENIIIREHSNVTATSCNGAAIGGGSSFSHHSSGSATGIQIYGHATVNASTNGSGAAIGAADGNRYAEAKVTIGTDGATAEQEDVHVTATSKNGAAIGNGRLSTTVIIQGNTTIENASSEYCAAIGDKRRYLYDTSDMSDTSITIKDNAHINTIHGGIYAIGGESGDGKTVTVNIDGGKNGNVVLGDVGGINGMDAAISGTSINIGDHVLIKLKQRFSTNGSGDKQYSKYLSENNAEKELTTVGDNTALWYTDYDNNLQKIVHGKNLCTKHETGRRQEANCTKDGWVEYGCTLERDNHAVAPTHKDTDTWKETIPALGHDWGAWTVTTPATCTKEGVETRTCKRDPSHVETRPIPATGHHWVDKGDGTHTCTNCGATEALPSNTNSALELRVVDAEGMDQPFTVSQNGTLRTYTGAYDTATLTGDLDTLRYLQDHGAQTIQFVTNGQTSSFVINDLLAQGSGSEVFYLTHRGAEEPTLLLVEADRSDLVKD